MPVSGSDFRRAMGQFATGITVVTTLDAEGRPLGLTVNAFTAVSLDPVLVLVCIDNRSETHDGFEASRRFGVSILAEGQEDWSHRFAFGGSEKFTVEPLLAGATGVPLVPGALAHIECRLHSRHPGGDHTIYVGEVVGLDLWPGRPLLYHASTYRRLDEETEG
jgi:flavin reductase (DIM6/NTAB) family NADH-FMN oxidoreductase RutF